MIRLPMGTPISVFRPIGTMIRRLAAHIQSRIQSTWRPRGSPPIDSDYPFRGAPRSAFPPDQRRLYNRYDTLIGDATTTRKTRQQLQKSGKQKACWIFSRGETIFPGAVKTVWPRREFWRHQAYPIRAERKYCECS